MNESRVVVDRSIHIRRLVEKGGHLFIQTLHSVTACGDGPYCDGWREGSWAGIAGDLAALAPWFFRTLYSRVERINSSPWQLKRLAEPCDPDTSQPLSLLLTAIQTGARPVASDTA